MKYFTLFNINLLAIMGIASYFKDFEQCLSQGNANLSYSVQVLSKNENYNTKLCKEQ